MSKEIKKVSECFNGRMVRSTKANSSRTCLRERQNTHGLMGSITKETTSITKEKGTGCYNTQTERNMKGNGRET